jgi:hypothetical protein
VTDLLIGDLFTDRVDKVWGPLETLYPAGKTAIPTWKQGTPQDDAPEKANELILPDAPRPHASSSRLVAGASASDAVTQASSSHPATQKQP